MNVCDILTLQGDSVPAADDGPFADTVTLEQKTSSIEGTSGKVSLWMQWMLPKVTVQLFAPEPGARKTGIDLNHNAPVPLSSVFYAMVYFQSYSSYYRYLSLLYNKCPHLRPF